jgi:hypothetical protein
VVGIQSAGPASSTLGPPCCCPSSPKREDRSYVPPVLGLCTNRENTERDGSTPTHRRGILHHAQYLSSPSLPMRVRLVISSLTYSVASSDITTFSVLMPSPGSPQVRSATIASLRPQPGGSIGGDHDAMIAIRPLRQTVADLVVVASILDEHVNHRLEPRG